MVNVIEELREYGLTEDSYEKLLYECQKKVNKETDKDWSEISEEFNLGFNGDTLRKASQTILGGSFVKEYYELKAAKGMSSNEEELFQKLEDKKRELEREKIKFRDQRREWSKQNYNAARIDETFSILEDQIKDFGRVYFPLVGETDNYEPVEHRKGMIVLLSDWHIGQCFKNNFGEYNTDIANERLGKYISKIVDAGARHKVTDVFVISLGDMLNGNIHKSIAVTNKENVIDQVKKVSEMMSSFCYSLAINFRHVYFSNVSGNHSRIDLKENAIHDERLDDLAGWIVKKTLSHVHNFEYMDNTLDTGIQCVNFMGKWYVAVHGDYDSITKTGIGNLCMMINKIPYAILCGHNHTSALHDINGVKVIQGGSLGGSGDQYTVEKRLSGKASQTFFICDDEGIECIYNVDFE